MASAEEDASSSMSERPDPNESVKSIAASLCSTASHISAPPELGNRDLERAGQTKSEEVMAPCTPNPYHTYSRTFRTLLVAIVAAVGTLSGLSSNIYFPVQADLAKGLNVSPETINLSITTYMIAQGIGPSIWGPIGDTQGRRLTLIMTTSFYLAANIALALTVNGPMLLVFRACQAFGSASTIALGAGVIADIFPPSERGTYLGWFSGVRQFSLAFGPVLGGVVAGNLGWRSIFWVLTGFASVLLLLIVLCLPETLRRISGNGAVIPSNWRYRPLLWRVVNPTVTNPPLCLDSLRDATEVKPAPPIAFHTFYEPLKLILEPDVFCALLFGACVYTAWSMMVASTTYTLQNVYNFNTMEVGFAFLANGLGCVAGSVLAGQSLNYDFRREIRLWRYAENVDTNTPFPTKALPTSFPIESARLGKGPLYSIVCVWGLLLFGWSVTAPPPGPTDDPKAHWITPLLAQAAVGWASTSVLTSNSALIVDLFPGRGASVSALMNMTRCLLGAAGVACVEPFLRAYAPGWTSVLLAGIVAVGCVPYSLHAFYGQRWRSAREQGNSESGARSSNAVA